MTKRKTRMYRSSDDGLRRLTIRPSASAPSKTSGPSWTSLSDGLRDARLTIKSRMAERRAQRAGLLPLINLVLAGHPFEVDRRGRLWVFVGAG